MTYTWTPRNMPFSRRVDSAEKFIPSYEVLTRCIGGLNRQIKSCKTEDKKFRLQQIKKEIEDLREAL